MQGINALPATILKLSINQCRCIITDYHILLIPAGERQRGIMKNKEEVLLQLKQLFTSQKFAVLSTNNMGQPYSNLVAFSSSEDLKALFFATTRSTRKYSHISQEHRVSLLIDNRANSSADLTKATAVTATGISEEAGGDEKERTLVHYLAKHPDLKEFVLSPSCALMKVAVETYYVVNRFQNVLELHMK